MTDQHDEKARDLVAKLFRYAARNFRRERYHRRRNTGEAMIDDTIAKLEASEVGSRELDGEIALLLNAPQTYFNKEFPEVEGPDCFDDAVWGGGGRRWEAPHYTTNLQDAVDAIPAQWAYRLQENLNGRQWVVLQQRDGDGWVEVDGVATMPLGICTAILKAIKSSDQ